MSRKLALLALLVAVASHQATAEWKPLLAEHYSKQGFTQTLVPKHVFSSGFGDALDAFDVGQQQQQQHSFGVGVGAGQCDLYKVGFIQDLYFQYVQYKVHMPELKEFTLCMWNKFTNHSNDHPLFSYAVDGIPRAIYSWVSNTARSSYFSLAVDGHTFYRLNYPLRLNRWYHSCQSWNGKTGEWQIWVNAERVGRGFHNRLVGHAIPGGGIVISGQEQTQYGGGFLEGAGAPKGSGGMLGEITMVQLYKVALSAGKAHKDHKHHHAHKFSHDGQPITTTPAPPPRPRPPQAQHPLLMGGQLNPQRPLNLANGQPQPILVPAQLPNGQPINAQLVNGQFVGNLVAEQLLNAQIAANQIQIPQTGQAQQLQQLQQLQPQQLQQLLPQQPQQQPLTGFGFGLEDGSIAFSAGQSSGSSSGQGPQTFTGNSQQPPRRPNPQAQPNALFNGAPSGPANVQFIDAGADLLDHQLFKREEKPAEFGDKVKKVKRAAEKTSTKGKRELFIGGGHIVDDSGLLLGQEDAYQGLVGLSDYEPQAQKLPAKDEREPAEAEVMAVMNVCGGCDEEPFAKALIFGWREVAKKLYSGAIYTPATPQCRVF